MSASRKAGSPDDGVRRLGTLSDSAPPYVGGAVAETTAERSRQTFTRIAAGRILHSTGDEHLIPDHPGRITQDDEEVPMSSSKIPEEGESIARMTEDDVEGHKLVVPAASGESIARMTEDDVEGHRARQAEEGESIARAPRTTSRATSRRPRRAIHRPLHRGRRRGPPGPPGRGGRVHRPCRPRTTSRATGPARPRRASPSPACHRGRRRGPPGPPVPAARASPSPADRGRRRGPPGPPGRGGRLHRPCNRGRHRGPQHRLREPHARP